MVYLEELKQNAIMLQSQTQIYGPPAFEVHETSSNMVGIWDALGPGTVVEAGIEATFKKQANK